MPIGTVIVLGGSVGGMLAAAAAAPHADRVVVIERDPLPGDLAVRKGVPQARHNHNVYARGHEIISALLPGFDDALRQRGGHVEDIGHCRWTIGGHRLARVDTDHLGVFASRPCMDAAMLACLRALPNVTIRDRTDVLGLSVVDDAVRGVRVASRADDAGEGAIPTDLVIDATGRGSRLGSWLEALGHAPALAEELEVRVAYATRTFRRAPTDLAGDVALFTSGKAPDLARGGVAFAIEGERWTVLLFGYGGVRPPTELDGFRAYARNLAHHELGELVSRAEPLDDGAVFNYPRAVRRRYDRATMPRGILAFGDAIVSTNPSWGAGMTSAALQARALGPLLADGVPPPARWHAAAIAASKEIWNATTQNDLGFTCVPGAQSLPMRLVGRYFGAACAAATEDAVVARVLVGVLEWMTPGPALLAPSIAARIAAHAWRSPTPPRSSRILDA